MSDAMPTTAAGAATPFRRVSLIGAPTDVGAGTRGSSMGPEALRVANLQAALEAHGIDVVDRGNLSGPANPSQAPVAGYRHLDEVVAWNRLVHGAVPAELATGRVPVVLHLLSPNYRPVQVTDDLRSFWTNTYVQVRKDLRNRYPRHSWPEDPWTATPEAKGGRRRS